MGRLSGKVAIITGGARGQGESHARRFISEGAKVVITDLLVNEGEALAKELGENAKFIQHNVAVASDWEKVVKETEAIFGPVNVLINNAGISLSKAVENVTEEEYRRVIDVNQVSVFLGMKTVLSSMRKANGGSIVNISSVAGLVGSANNLAYTASKFAVRGMTKAAALEFAKYGIRVNSVHPGMIYTPMFYDPNRSPEDNKKAVDEILKGIPVNRLAQPEEVSNLVLYLASDESSYSTGSEFVIDGGVTASW